MFKEKRYANTTLLTLMCIFTCACSYSYACIIFLNILGKRATSDKAEVVYDYPDGLQLQEYRPKNNDKDIKLKECPAYEKPNEQPNIELVDCPAYVEKKKDRDITLTECPAYEKPTSKQLDIELVDCPAYVEKKKNPDIKLEGCPAYGQIALDP